MELQVLFPTGGLLGYNRHLSFHILAVLPLKDACGAAVGRSKV